MKNLKISRFEDWKISLVLACIVLLGGCEEVPQYILPMVETLETSTATKDEAVVQGTFILGNRSGQFVRRAFEFSSENNVNSLNNNRYYFDEEFIDLSGTTTLTVSFTNLSPSTTYYYRAVLVPLTNYLSDPVYGQVMSVTTADAPKIKVTVTTEDAFSVTSTTAYVRGKYMVQNGTIKEVGIVGSSQTATPTINDNYSLHSKATEYKTSFSGFWYHLHVGTKYYYRAYAIDSDGNIYYGSIKTFTTKTEPGGSLTRDDFIGTFTVSAYSPWEKKNVTWTGVEIMQYDGDTLVAVGLGGNADFRASGIFDQGLQVVRWESNWFWEAYTFDVSGYTCVAVFTPIYFDESASYAYFIESGGKDANGEIWLRKNGSTYSFGGAAGISNEGYYANGFLYNYFTTSDWERHDNSQAYINVTMTRTSTTTSGKWMPARIPSYVAPLRNKIQHNENETTDTVELDSAAEQR